MPAAKGKHQFLALLYSGCCLLLSQILSLNTHGAVPVNLSSLLVERALTGGLAGVGKGGGDGGGLGLGLAERSLSGSNESLKLSVDGSDRGLEGLEGGLGSGWR